MVKKYLLLLGIYTIFMVSILPAQKQTYDKASYIPKITKEMPLYIKANIDILSVKSYNDRTGIQKCQHLNPDMFQKASLPYFPGFYEGTMWIEITFRVQRSDFCLITFGNEFLNFAEAYIKTGSFWQFIGRTGKCVDNSSNSMTSWKCFIPLKLKDNSDAQYTIRIRTSTFFKEALDIGIIPEQEFFQTNSKNLFSFGILLGLSAVIICILLIVALFNKEKTNLFIALTSIVQIIMYLHVSGIGNAFFWNKLSSIPLSARFMNIFYGIMTIFFTLSVYSLLKEENKHQSFIKIMPLIFEFTGAVLILTCMIASHSANFITFIVISCISDLILTASIAYNYRKISFSAKVITASWGIVILYNIYVRMLLLFRTHTVMTENYLQLLIVSILISVPSLFFVGKRFNRKFTNITNLYEDLVETNRHMMDEYNIEKKVIMSLSRTADLNMNTACILEKIDFNPDHQEYLELIKINSSKISSTLSSLNVKDKEINARDNSILINDFFQSCLKIAKFHALKNENQFSVKNNLEKNYVAYADPKVLELIFVSFLVSVFNTSEKRTKISIHIENVKDKFLLSISNKALFKSVDEVENALHENKDGNIFYFITTLIEVYKGNFYIDDIEGGFRFTLKLRFERNSETKQSTNIITKTLSEPEDVFAKSIFNTMDEKKTPENSNDEKNKISETEVIIGKKVQEQPAEEKKQTSIDEKNFELSKRELEIANLIADGKTDKEIASMLNISPQTVASHNKKIFKKLDVHSRVELMGKLR